MKDCVIIGPGQLGGVFAHGFLRTDHRVSAARRGDSLERLADEVPGPELVLVAVGEADLASVLEALPKRWTQIGLLQNELLPGSWAPLTARGLEPTVASIWFEKKKPIAPKVIRSTPIAGARAQLLVDALASLDIAAHAVEKDALVGELVLKNLYILTANIAGLATPKGTTTGVLWNDHRKLAEDLAREALKLQRALLRESGHGDAAEALDEQSLLKALGTTFLADPEHGARGRSAPARRERALAQAKRLGVDAPTMHYAGGR